MQSANIALASQQTIRIDIPLSIGDNVAEVSVSAVPVINSETPTISSIRQRICGVQPGQQEIAASIT